MHFGEKNLPWWLPRHTGHHWRLLKISPVNDGRQWRCGTGLSNRRTFCMPRMQYIASYHISLTVQGAYSKDRESEKQKVAFKSNVTHPCAIVHAVSAPVTLTVTWWPWCMNWRCTFGRCARVPQMNFLCQKFLQLQTDIPTCRNTTPLCW